MARAQRERALVIAFGHRTDRGLADRDDGRQYHDREYNRSREHAAPVPAERLAYKWDDDHQSEKAVNNRWNPRQQLDGGP
ncbi:hypothetical protein SDC9_187750 [bioreactor metagenome]|uniref:Uncharacterized protein n=1 Tax=bioreactor metagenome TaxID=1076179 RepID=A0A645HVM0_9ZZZZ